MRYLLASGARLLPGPVAPDPVRAAWYVYFIRARGGVLYAGITTDLELRLCAHRSGRGAKYLRGRGPLRLVFSRELGEHGLALRVEQRLKRLAKPEKEDLVRAAPSRARLLRILRLPDPDRSDLRGPRSRAASA